jgi:hypothetical protein
VVSTANTPKEMCTFGIIRADDSCSRKPGPKPARMPPRGGKGKGVGLGAELPWHRGSWACEDDQDLWKGTFNLLE